MTHRIGLMLDAKEAAWLWGMIYSRTPNEMQAKIMGRLGDIILDLEASHP